jgi:hypothetical protein
MVIYSKRAVKPLLILIKVVLEGLFHAIVSFKVLYSLLLLKVCKCVKSSISCIYGEVLKKAVFV